MEDEVVEEIRKLRKTAGLAVLAYVIFWSLVILFIHFVMIPAVKSGG